MGRTGLFKLPFELREHIFCYTNVLAPFPLHWSPDLGLQTSLDRRNRKCGDCVDRCRCSRDSTAFSTANCSCWTFPIEMFLVSKRTNEDVTEIFYSKNRFIVRQGVMMETITPVVFLSRLPPKALPRIRFLEYRFQLFDVDKVACGTTDLGIEWEVIADFFLQNLTLPKLHLVLDSSRDLHHVLEDRLEDSELKWAEYVTWLGYLRMVKAFERLEGLHKLHIYMLTDMISYGNEYSGNIFIHYLEADKLGEGIINNERRIGDERKLEKWVMGIKYDSDKEGKYIDLGNGWRVRNEDSWTTVCRKHRRLGFSLLDDDSEPDCDYDDESDISDSSSGSWTTDKSSIYDGFDMNDSEPDDSELDNGDH